MKLGTHDLSARLGYRFRNAELLESALTHRSYGQHNNERLEFLGDALLNFVIANELYHRRPGLEEGDLSRLRAALVREETLAEIALELGLGDHLRLGIGARKSGGFRRQSILADALEAVLGAIYLDGGFESAVRVIAHCYRGRLENLPPAAELKDAKTRLQEYLQARRQPLPGYQVLEISGAEHAQVFKVGCQVQGMEQMFIGEGRSRREAEQRSAQQALEVLDGKS